MKLILVEDDGRHIDLLGDDDAISTVDVDTNVRSILKAVRYILGTPEGGSVLDTAILSARRAKLAMDRLDNMQQIWVPIQRDLLRDMLDRWSHPVRLKVTKTDDGYRMMAKHTVSELAP